MNSLDIKEIRSKLKLSQSELAKMLGISLRTVQNWEAGEAIPKTKHEILRSLQIGKLPIDKKTDDVVNETGSVYNKTLKEEGVPLIPIEAMAGFGTGSIQVMDYDTQRYIVPEFTELKTDFMIRVKGSSMYPKYNSGDIVACKKLPLDTFFQWNKVYVLDTIQGAMIKRIHKSKQEGHITCVSDNEKYEPFEISTDEINALALVVGVIRLE
ncbi:MAG: S24 family peptidase [Flavobacterium sp.]